MILSTLPLCHYNGFLFSSFTMTTSLDMRRTSLPLIPHPAFPSPSVGILSDSTYHIGSFGGNSSYSISFSRSKLWPQAKQLGSFKAFPSAHWVWLVASFGRGILWLLISREPFWYGNVSYTVTFNSNQISTHSRQQVGFLNPWEGININNKGDDRPYNTCLVN